MIAVLGTDEHLSTVRIEDMAARAKPRGIPILVDAASEHLERPSPWFARGADLVIYSGGKFLRGPQTSGLLLGRRDLVQAAWRNASPHQALGRPMKVSKEDVVGLLAAVEYWMENRDVAAEEARWRGDLAAMAAALAGLADVRCTVREPQGVVRVPSLQVSWDAAGRRLSGEALRLRLQAGEPRVMVDDMSAGADSITLDPFGLQPGEAKLVGQAIAAALSAPPVAPEIMAAPTADLSGVWVLTTRFLHGARTHRVVLRQDGNALTGTQSSPQFSGAVRGAIKGGDVWLDLETRYEGSTIRYALAGTAAGDAMSGVARLGTANDQHQGSVNLAQFGEAHWSAVRG
jgi:L-seryl-tRNA(Ser) seleniumtransferase